MQFSLEFYPAINENGHLKLKETIALYASEVRPRFVSLTCGAGGSIRDPERDARTLETLTYMRECGLPVMAHLPHAGRSRQEAMDLLNAFRAAGAEMVLALRGDLFDQGGYTAHPQGYAHTADFIADIKSQYPDMPVFAAGYPEKHPESPTSEFDLKNLKRKVDAGASGVLGQFCFDADIVSKWQKKCRDHQIDAPLIPGIIALLNYARVCERAERCHANIPENVHATFRGLKQGSTEYSQAVLEIMERQIDELGSVDLTHIHVYALNSPKFISLLARLKR